MLIHVRFTLSLVGKKVGQEMARLHFGMIKSSLRAGLLIVALCFQMLPFFMLLVVVAYNLGVTGGGALMAIPLLFFILVAVSCGLASKRTSISPGQAPDWTPPEPRRRAKRFRRDPVVVLMKSRAERYRDLQDILGQAWR